MRSIFHLLSITLFCYTIEAQTISSYVITSAGSSIMSTEGGLYLSVGEAINTELDNGEIMISQGFLQVSITGNVVNNESVLKEEITVFPNPTFQYVEVKTKDIADKYSFTVYNTEGLVLINKQLLSNRRIYFDAYPNAIYYLTLHKDGKSSETIKIIKTD